MQVIPLQAVSAQSVRCTLGGQSCRIDTHQKSTGLYMNLYVNDALVVAGVLCWVATAIVRSTYLGFSGDLAFFDLQPSEAPLTATAEPGAVESAGLGTRYFLAYLP